MKWSKKLQKLLVKLRSVRAGQVQKVRKQRGKEMSKRAKLLASSANVQPSRLAKLISESQRLRDSLSFKDQLYLYHSVIKGD